VCFFSLKAKDTSKYGFKMIEKSIGDDLNSLCKIG